MRPDRLGLDLERGLENDVVEVTDLVYAKQGMRPYKWVLAARIVDIHDPQRPPGQARGDPELVEATRKYLAAHGVRPRWSSPGARPGQVPLPGRCHRGGHGNQRTLRAPTTCASSTYAAITGSAFRSLIKLTPDWTNLSAPIAASLISAEAFYGGPENVRLNDVNLIQMGDYINVLYYDFSDNLLKSKLLKLSTGLDQPTIYPTTLSASDYFNLYVSNRWRDENDNFKSKNTIICLSNGHVAKANLFNPNNLLSS